MNAQYLQQEMAKKTALNKKQNHNTKKSNRLFWTQVKKKSCVKRELLESVFEDVLQVMLTWSGETLRLFIESAIRNYQNNNKQLLLLERQLFLDWARKINMLTSAIYFCPSMKQLFQRKWFVLKQEGIEYNYLFEALIEDLKEEYSPILARKHSLGKEGWNEWFSHSGSEYDQIVFEQLLSKEQLNGILVSKSYNKH